MSDDYNESKKFHRIKDIKIKYSADIQNLEEDTVYTGVVKDCYAMQNDEKNILILQIHLDDGSDFSTPHNFPLASYSPLNKLFRHLEDGLGHSANLSDLLAYKVEFTIKYNTINDKEYCNIYEIDFVYEDSKDDNEADDDIDEDEDDEDENDTDEDEDDEDYDENYDENESTEDLFDDPESDE